MAEPIITTYTLFGLPPEHPAAHHYAITIDRSSFKGDVWAVRYFGDRLSRRGVWDAEPTPSSRTDAWKKRHQFSLQEAIGRAREELPMIVVNGLTAAQVLEKYPLRPD